MTETHIKLRTQGAYNRHRKYIAVIIIFACIVFGLLDLLPSLQTKLHDRDYAENNGGGSHLSMPYYYERPGLMAANANATQQKLQIDEQYYAPSLSTGLIRGRRILLDTASNDHTQQSSILQCPPKITIQPPHSIHHPLHHDNNNNNNKSPEEPIHIQSTYAVSFPGSGDKMITKYLVEAITGLYVGEASISPSYEKILAQQGTANRNQQPVEVELEEQFDGEGGLLTGEVRGQGEVVAVRTSFPHTSGKLASWDDDIPRAFVILRNPLHALPCYFDRLYEIRNHLPTGSSRKPENRADIQSQWTKWRDTQFHSQLMLYRRFVSFWMEKYLGTEDNRIFFSYEEFINEEKGPEQSVRLYNFLHEGIKDNALDWIMNSMVNNDETDTADNKGKKKRRKKKKNEEEEEEEELPLDAFLKEGLTPEESINKVLDESTKTVVTADDVPCLWKEVVYSTVTSAPSGKKNSADRQRRQQRIMQEKKEESDTTNSNQNYDSFDGGDWNPNERPYTPENLASMSEMILELMNRWSRHQRLLTILSTYHREVNRAYLSSVGELEHAIKEADELSKVAPVDLEKEANNQQQQQQQPQQPQTSPVNDAMWLPQPQQPQEVQFQQDQTQQQQSTEQQQQPTEQQLYTGPTDPYPFHIMLASSANNSASAIALNWLMGLFEPTHDIAFMNDWPKSPITKSGRDITTSEAIVLTTNQMDELLDLYRLIRPRVEEVFFVITYESNAPDICGYKNCLCLQSNQLRYNTDDELRAMVISLTEKFRNRFEYYFGNGRKIGSKEEYQAVERLEAMAKWSSYMTNESADKVDLKYGVHGNIQSGATDTNPNNDGTKEMPMDLRRRRLSIALPNGGCEVTWPEPPQRPFQTAYAASYPGCGARMSWNLIEALTGLWTGDDWDSNNRGKRVVTVKTHYPHHAGRLVPFDDEIKRALVIIRNPMASIPSFFNHIYEIKNHLPVHSERAPVAAWIEWRDRLAMPEIDKFGRFVDYWMERFVVGGNKDRIFISYEQLTDDNDGPEETIRINNFLGESEGITPIETEAVPCIWRTVVKFKQQLEPNEPPKDEGRRRLDPEHHNSQRSGPTERPYTPELLEAMIKMLSGLIEKWGDRNQRLKGILHGYQAAVQAASLDPINQQAAALPSNVPQTSTPQIPSTVGKTRGGKSFHIFQASTTGSTVLNNLLAGLFDPESDFKQSSLISKAPGFDLLPLYKNEKDKGYDEVFFIVVKDEQMDKELCEFNNLLCISHLELLYNTQQDLQDMVSGLTNRLQSRFEYFLGPEFFTESNKIDAVKRLESMDKAVAALDGKAPDEDSGTIPGSSSISNKVNGKSFHIFQASPEPSTASSSFDASFVATNWLMGMFEPDQDISFMANDAQHTVKQNDRSVSIDTTIVTKTHVLDLMVLYKHYRSQFDEIIFVVTDTPEPSPVYASLCEYDNVLCLGYNELSLADGDVGIIVRNLTKKFRSRFEYFFGKGSYFLSDDKAAAAVRRLLGMSMAQASIAEPKHEEIVGSGAEKVVPGKLFYCGGPRSGPRGLDGPNFSYSTFGLWLAQSLFPDFEGVIRYTKNNRLEVTATPLMAGYDAKSNDMLIMHSHQHCEVPVEEFPGIQLYINAEHYDLHPAHLDNAEGKLTYDYLPPGDNAFVLGLHEDTSRSIRVPYVSMRLWFLHMTDQVDLRLIFDPLQKPKNTKENFMLYINSHYIEHREQAARVIAEQVGTIHTGGKCQGNFEASPVQPLDDSATQCIPFDDDQRPLSIQPIQGDLGTENMHHNRELYSKYRYALVMENDAPPGYVSEKILAAFLSGTIPIYWGSRFIFEIFNPKSFIFFDLDIPHQALDQIKYLEQNPAAYDEMLNEPILANNGRETIEKYFSWDEAVGDGRLKARIREMVGL